MRLLLAASVAPSLGVLIAVALLGGASAAASGVARQSYVVEVVPVARRARVMSVVGGAGRIGQVLGPLAGAGAQTLVGLDGAYLVGAAALGLWALVGEAGSATGPLVASAFAGLVSVDAAALVLGGGSVLGAAWLVRQVPRYDPRRAAEVAV